MKYCRRCVFPDTKPDLFFDKEGICDACRSSEKKDQGIDWEARKQELGALLEKYRSKDGSNYDCIIPVSGGKDSHYQTYVVTKLFHLRPLCVCFEPTLPTALGRKNLRNLNRLGVDLLHIKRDPVVYKKLVIEGLRRVGDNEWPNHVGIFTTPVQIAVKFNIPLLIWGENPQIEYGGPARGRVAKILDRRWLEEFGGLLGNRVEDMRESLGLSRQEMLPYFYPSDQALKNVGVTGVFLGYFLKWNTRAQIELMKKSGFQTHPTHVEGTYTDFENLDCDSMTVHDYLKFVKYGFGRGTDHACLDIRLGLIARKKGVRLVEEYDGKLPQKSMNRLLDYLGWSREEFFKTIDPFVNKIVFAFNSNGRPKRASDGNLIMKKEIIEARRRP
ncbi:N-acetyl sugar amidotransferase [Candidatus Collierbacteria bacterium]|nr:N-acetyl sugar amidotransferase [Candidatus Collierbacteria bacterium]